MTGKLVTRGNQPINVNGISTNSGSTIMSGATISTGDNVGATINLGKLGSVDIAPNTEMMLEFSADGSVKIMLTRGCVILRVKNGTYGEINTSQGKATSNDPTTKVGTTLDVCFPEGAPAPIVNQGAASNAGAGSGIGAGQGGTGGLSNAQVATLLAGAGGAIIIALIIANRGDDSSPSS
jgi:hypothetical protein